MDELKNNIKNKIKRAKKRIGVYWTYLGIQLPIAALAIASIITGNVSSGILLLGTATLCSAMGYTLLKKADNDYNTANEALKSIEEVEKLKNKDYVAEETKSNSATKEDYTTYTGDRDNSLDTEKSKE